MATKFEAGHVLTMDDSLTVYSPGAVVFEGQTLVYVGPPDRYRESVAQEVVIPEGVLMPGLINGHSHAAMSLMRGLADDSPFFEWLTQHVWPVEARLTADDIRLGVLLAAAEMIHSGTVGFADMYFEVDAACESVDKSGMRAWISRGLDKPSEEKLAQSLEFCRTWRGRADGRIQTMLGPHAPYTCPPEFLQEIAESAVAHALGIHIHLSESAEEMRQMQERYQKTPIQLAYDAGIFKARTLIAHGVYIQEDDLPYLEGLAGGVISCPVSNAKLGNGILPYPLLRGAGVTVGLGTDGAASTNSLDMFLEMKALAWMQKMREGKPEAFRAIDALWAATRGSAAVLGHQGGMLALGRPADFIVVDGKRAHTTPELDVVANLVYAASGADVRYVVINGHIVLQEGIITTFDEKAVLQEAQTRAEHLLEGRDGA
ncbi:MAG: amidohydrolase [Thermaerobacter sp.]|nr:amidohydrolase [Thermaerobacter sp.]